MIKELEDYTWFPPLLRRFQMDFIGFMVNRLKVYEPAVPLVKQFIEKNNVTIIHDTCSGSGAPAVFIHRQINFSGETVLSDKFPDHSFIAEERIAYIKNAVDVLHMPVQAGVCYTMYNALHHFTDEQKLQLVQQMREGKALLLFAEILQPGIITLVKIIFTTTVLQLLLTPFIKPFSLLRIFFTYILPVNLFTITYDGVVSVFKSATANTYHRLFLKQQTTDYRINVSEIKNWKSTIVYITGNPVLP
jgi:hypothetical protein